ncbi:hypothetical protein PGUG_00693 [Meyerozyma guilliermondii ATCC 6260]|uniref:C3H1-type domain-containing protein n=1 Tax=Meyerozyma guilliermondii (strain ATCC 6260 / CBS 566 / DSM 6381 / JCM 1539 / NBRC 10279 / NRRL Y-324) TaxID=294746 RepID=A5DBN8_PICGU|nr:uncharacterized protein PGUG_00693 [Meyerozyma guilliermondii ATCC 6260]EDK36595.2 hypothetical protein PGUG_00693 [Meyerozyma guilliermondii ATCC 6260]
MADFGGLPTHLPNTAPEPSTLVNETEQNSPEIPDRKESINKNEEISIGSSEATSQLSAPYIPGTSIKLETDEDIAKWIEDRKRNWPSKKNIEQKKKRPAPPAIPHESAPSKRPRNVCRFFQQHGRCKFGKNCKNVHESSGGTKSGNSSNIKTINDITVSIPQRFKNDDSQSSLFRKLIQKDHFENENEKVLDFILYLQSKNLVDHNVTMNSKA